jgi:hypothetical protein
MGMPAYYKKMQSHVRRLGIISYPNTFQPTEMPGKPEPPKLFLKDPVFQDIFRRIEIHAVLLRMVKEGLPSGLAKHCLDCVAREDGSLVIFTDSQAVASQLRFFAPTLLGKINVNLVTPLKQVLVRNLSPEVPAAAAKPMTAASPAAIEAVKAGSKAAPCDELATALAKLGAAMEQNAKEKT